MSKFLVYDIHINGTYHCSARFRKLRELYEALKREFGAGSVGEFPSKTVFYLRKEESNSRRLMLEKFLQSITRNPHMVAGSTFQNFLLNAQNEVERGIEEEVQLDILLPNGKSVLVDVISTSLTDDVLEAVCAHSHTTVNSKYTHHLLIYELKPLALLQHLKFIHHADMRCSQNGSRSHILLWAVSR